MISPIIGGDKGTFVNAIALASGALDYLSQVSRELDIRGFFIGEIEGSEPLVRGPAKWTVDQALLDLAVEIAKTGEVTFGTFYRYAE